MKNFFINGVLIGILFFFGFACKGASSPAPGGAPPPVSSPSKTETAPSDETADMATQWMEGMKSVLPGLFCKDGSYFRECFRISQRECEDEAIRVTRVCVESKKDDLLKKFKAEDGKMWGEKVGECAGSSFELSFQKKKVDSAKCSDASQWM